jgi:hypothetical protein
MALCPRLGLGQKGGGGASPAAAASAAAQTPGASPAGGAAPAGGTAASALPGISFPKGSWKQVSFLPPPETFSLSHKHLKPLRMHNYASRTFLNTVLVYCYTLEANDSGTTPFLLVPAKEPATAASINPSTASPNSSSASTAPIKPPPPPTDLCANEERRMDKGGALLMGRYLVFRIDMNDLPPETRERIQTLNINVTSQSGTSFNAQRGSTINPTVIRPGMALLSGKKFSECDLPAGQPSPILDKLGLKYSMGLVPAASFASSSRTPPSTGPTGLAPLTLESALCGTIDNVYYLTWPAPLVGDTVPTVSINLVYTPVATAQPYEANTFYPAGSVVSFNFTNHTTNGHYYVSLNPGISGADPGTAEVHATPIEEFPELGIYWRDLGAIPSGGQFDEWMPNHAYTKDESMVRPQQPSANDHYYQAQTSGTSGPSEPVFPTDGGTVYDPPAGLTWKLAGRLGIPAPAAPAGMVGQQQAQPSSEPKPTCKPWQPKAPYQVGDQVTPSLPLQAGNSPNFGFGNGHYFEATADGTSGATEPTFDVPTSPTLTDDGIKWTDKGLITIPTWAAGTGYDQGAYVAPTPANGFYYQAQTGGVSGSVQPAFPVLIGEQQPLATADDLKTVAESEGLVWLDAGTGASAPAAIKTLKTWTPETAYALGDGILDPQTGHYYAAIQPGTSGKDEPPFYVVETQQATTAKWAPPETRPSTASSQTSSEAASANSWSSDSTITWQDLGSTLPAGTTLGTQPADQTANLLNLTYPQIQVLSRFNLTSGVVVTTLKPPTVSTFTGSASNGSAICPAGLQTCSLYTSEKGGRLVDPVLGVTIYAIRPLDAERPWTPGDLVPSPSFYFSLTSPTSNYHVGFASEAFYRNLQLIYGASIVQNTRVAGAPAMTSANPPAPIMVGNLVAYSQTKKVFNAGAFFGITFNITGFIQTLIP